MEALETEVSHQLQRQRRSPIGNPASLVPRLITLYRRGSFPIERLMTPFRAK